MRILRDSYIRKPQHPETLGYYVSMAYYVLGEQGQKYGPADLSTLNLWIGEGRIVFNTMLEDEASGGRIVASSVQGLNFPLASPQVASNYPRPGQAPMMQPPTYSTTSSDSGASDIRLAFILAAVSPFLSFFLPIGGLISAGYGMRAARRAQQAGHPLGLLGVVLCVAAMLFWAVCRLLGLGRGIFLR